MRAGAAAGLATFSGLLGFTIGYFWASKKWQKLADEEIESVKNTYRCRFSTVLDEDKIEEVISEPVTQNDTKPEPVATVEEEEEGFTVYTVDEWDNLGELPNPTDMGYGVLYADDTWCMDDDEPMILAQRIETFGSAENLNKMRDILQKEGTCYVQTPYGAYEMVYDIHPYDDRNVHPRPNKVVIEDDEDK